MSKCSEKIAPVSAAGRVLSRGLSAAGRKMQGASWPETAGIVRKNRPFTIFEFFRAGSKPVIASGATAQIAPVWNHEHAESPEETALRPETSRRIKLPARDTHRSARFEPRRVRCRGHKRSLLESSLQTARRRLKPELQHAAPAPQDSDCSTSALNKPNCDSAHALHCADSVSRLTAGTAVLTIGSRRGRDRQRRNGGSEKYETQRENRGGLLCRADFVVWRARGGSAKCARRLARENGGFPERNSHNVFRVASRAGSKTAVVCAAA